MLDKHHAKRASEVVVSGIRTISQAMVVAMDLNVGILRALA